MNRLMAAMIKKEAALKRQLPQLNIFLF